MLNSIGKYLEVGFKKSKVGHDINKNSTSPLVSAAHLAAQGCIRTDYESKRPSGGQVTPVHAALHNVLTAAPAVRQSKASILPATACIAKQFVKADGIVVFMYSILCWARVKINIKLMFILVLV